MADGWELERGFEYHASFIYNQPKLKNKRHTNPDWETSLAVVKFIVELMRDWRYDKTYYNDRDALPGGNVFTEFFTVVKKSSYTIVIVTTGFVENCWGRYKSQAAFIKLLENSKSNRFIAVYIDIDDHHIPEEFGTMVSMSFSANWRDEMEEWNRLRNLIKYVPIPIQDTGRDLFPATGNTPNNQGIQQYQHHAGRHDLRSTINTELQHSQRNPASGLQETQPPNLIRAGGRNIMADGPLDRNVLADGPSSADIALSTIPSSTQPNVNDTQNRSTDRNSNNNHSFNDRDSLRSSTPIQSMSVRSTSSVDSTTNRPSSDHSGMPTTSSMTTTSDMTTTSSMTTTSGMSTTSGMRTTSGITTTSGMTTTSGVPTASGVIPTTSGITTSGMTTTSGTTTTSNSGEADPTTSGLAQGPSSQTVQREDSVDTIVKRLVSTEIKDGEDLLYCSLNQTDVEADNQASGQFNSSDTHVPQMPSGAAKFERLKVDYNDQDDSGFLDFASLQRSDHSVNISPESIGANRINDQTPSPTTAGYSLPVQTPTSKDPDNPSLFNWMTSLIPDKETRSKAVRYVTNMLVKSDQSFM